MGHRKRFFVTKSDLIFAALLALAIWLGICWYFGSTNYRLTCRLEEQIRVSGVVRTNTGYVPAFDFAYSSNAGGGLHSSEYEPHQSVKQYELMLPGAWAYASYRSGEWLAGRLGEWQNQPVHQSPYGVVAHRAIELRDIRSRFRRRF